MTAIKSNKKIEITDAIRCEIVTATVTMAMVHTLTPTPQEYTILAEKIVSEFPVLADTYGCGFVSNYESVLQVWVEFCCLFCFKSTWRNRIVQKFKNVRRPTKRRHGDESVSPTAKIPRLGEDANEMDDGEYEQCVKELNQEMKRAHPRSGKVKDLMDKTKTMRRKWIKSSKPTSLELVEKFPFLRVEKWVCNRVIISIPIVMIMYN